MPSNPITEAQVRAHECGTEAIFVVQAARTTREISVDRQQSLDLGWRIAEAIRDTVQRAEAERDALRRLANSRSVINAALATAKGEAEARVAVLEKALGHFAKRPCRCPFSLSETAGGVDCSGECDGAIARAAIAQGDTR